MKVCVTAGAEGLDAPVDPRFGRCPFFVLVDLESMVADSVPNTSAGAAGGAGIQAAQMLANLGAGALITGNIGPNAMQTLSAAGIKVYQHRGGMVRDAVEQFKRGELVALSEATAPVHAGMAGTGYGRGGGGGQGGAGYGGGGRGRGGGGPGGSGRGSGGRGGGRW
jgi:predicted Fe-Mo cluster-binding NifX family protein